MAIRETDVLCGHIRGIAAGNPAVTAFKGIPYAEAPLEIIGGGPPYPKSLGPEPSMRSALEISVPK